MVNTNLEQYPISDFIEWNSSKRLTLNPYFQRNSIWPSSAKTYLIDTILNDLPIPKIYMRSKIDIASKKAVREVIDGQQRIRAILDFADDKLVLSSRSKNFKGLRFSTLDDDYKHKFLSYSLSVDQLINASDEDILEIFSRLNSYGIRLNPPELRHAEYQGALKWAIVDMTRQYQFLWDEFEVISLAQRTRMLDHSLMAEMCQIIVEGVKDGGQPKITSFYDRHDNDDFDPSDLMEKMDTVLTFIKDNFSEAIKGALSSPPHFLLLFAATAKSLVGIPRGDFTAQEFDSLPSEPLGPIDAIQIKLQFLSRIIAGDERTPEALKDFVEKSSSSTQRIKSRKARLPVFLKALQAKPW